MAAPQLLRVVIGMVMVAAVMVANYPVTVEAGDHGGGSELPHFVLIQNQLPGTLNVHCWSGDDDLRLQTMPPGAQYKFSFNLNWKGTTAFVCRFDYLGTNMWQQFKVYKGPGFLGMGHNPCSQCVWEVKPDGFFRAQEFLAFVKVYSWNHSFTL